MVFILVVYIYIQEIKTNLSWGIIGISSSGTLFCNKALVRFLLSPFPTLFGRQKWSHRRGGPLSNIYIYIYINLYISLSVCVYIYVYM